MLGEPLFGRGPNLFQGHTLDRKEILSHRIDAALDPQLEDHPGRVRMTLQQSASLH